jgi:type IV pilus assembly protein PilF
MLNRIQSTSTCCALLLSMLLSACVSETTGGFDRAPPQEALDNYLRLAQGYIEQGDITTARRHLNNAAQIDGNNSDVYGIWGLIYTLEGDLDLADDSFRRAIRLNGDNSQVRNNYAAFLFSNGRYADAYDQLQVVVRDTSYPNRPQGFENMRLSALQLDRVDDAELAFNRALQLNGNRVRSTLELVEINLRRGDVNQAAEYYQCFLTMQQFFNLQQNARSLWIGIQLEEARGGNAQMREYASLLTERFPNSAEYAQYRQLVDE